MKRRRRRARRLLTPQDVDQAVGGDDASGFEQKRSEHGPLLVTPEQDRARFADDLERAEQAEFEHVLFVTPAAHAGNPGLAAG